MSSLDPQVGSRTKGAALRATKTIVGLIKEATRRAELAASFDGEPSLAIPGQARHLFPGGKTNICWHV